MDPIRIAIVEDQPLARHSLSALLKTIDGIQLIMEAADGGTFLQLLAGDLPTPDIAIIDINMPGLTGMDLNELLRERYPAIRVIVLSIHAQERLVSKMINAGARAYINKNCEVNELVTAIRAVHQVGFYMNEQTMKAIQNVASYRNKKVKNLHAIPIELTAREKEILALICKEQSNSEIADNLNLSVRTIEGHRNNLLMKIGCKNTAGLVLFAVKYGIVDVL
jgi:DNA-binding NarL/FixJ family response regulator